jgi:hypothetical protein
MASKPLIISHLQIQTAEVGFGGNGRTAPTASRNCGAGVCRSSTRRSPPARRPGSGACPDIRRSNRPCATRTSTASVFPTFMFLRELNPIEPPGTDPYARWCGRGGAARRPPIPINQAGRVSARYGRGCALSDHHSAGSVRYPAPGVSARSALGRPQPAPPGSCP